MLDEAAAHAQNLSDLFRHQSLELELDAAEGLATLNSAVESEDVFGDPSSLATVCLGRAEHTYELWAPAAAKGFLSAALGDGLEALPFNKWRLDKSLRLLPPALIKAAVPEHVRVEVIAWLDERQLERNLGWDETWVKHLMIERAIGDTERVARLVDLGLRWIPAQSNIYEVWRPLVEMHAQTRTLEQLIRMPLTSGAERRFGPRLAAALHIVADLVDRELVELTTHERDELRTRAAARDALPPALRLGWWAIELALLPDA